MMARTARRLPGTAVGPWAMVTVLALCMLQGAALSPVAVADEIRPALLDITERVDGWVDVTWKVPMRGGRVLSLRPLLPETLFPLGSPIARLVPGAKVERSTYRAEGGSLVGGRIAVEGLSALRIDVLVQVALADGTHHSTILRPGDASFTIPARAGKGEVARDYLRLGFVHILEGADHLLFVLALLLLVSGFWRLVKTITAFTVAHSITLTLATVGVVHLPAKPTEAIIALSIVFLAAEILRRHVPGGQPGLTERWPWLVAFGFGLFHGLGFAGALAELGVPQHEVPLALLTFNVGVEVGQLVFVLGVLGLLGFARAIHLPVPGWGWRAASYAIGGVAAFWTIERVAGSIGLPA